MTRRDGRKGRSGILVVVALIMGLSATPGVALAQHPQGAPSGPHMAEGHRVQSHAVAPHPVMSRPPFQHPLHRRFVSVWSPAVVYALPPVAYDTPTYYDPPAYDPPAVYDPAPVYAPSATISTAPPNDTIEYPTGRYQLRGDGVSMPYTWVWIPNPPPSPPAAAPPIGAPSMLAPPPDPSLARPTHLYQWTDEQGVVHMTDVRDSVPSRYQAQAKQVPPF
jgi:hypothetical protein